MAKELYLQDRNHTRGTLEPKGDRVHVQYVSGAKVWETPSVAERAIAHRLATRIPEKSASQNK